MLVFLHPEDARVDGECLSKVGLRAGRSTDGWNGMGDESRGLGFLIR